MVWVVGDATVDGSETGTSFRQALYFKEIGFNLHDTMIYEKAGVSFPDTNWYGCYRDGWADLIVPESFAHPAKYSRSLIQRIYQHAREEGWLPVGSTVVDPFGGVALGAFDAMSLGCTWLGVELEPRFTIMANGMDCPGISKAQWVRFFGRWSKGGACPTCESEAARVIPHDQGGLFGSMSASYVRNSGRIPETGAHRFKGNLEIWREKRLPGTARLVQGDSRNLSAVVAEADCVVSSPPFSTSLAGNQSESGVLGQMQRGENKTSGGRFGKSLDGDYGTSPGQLGALLATDRGFDQAISSPPYANIAPRNDKDYEESKLTDAKQGLTAARATWGHNRGSSGQQGYGHDTPGQMEGLPATDKGFDAAIGSPPFAESLASGGKGHKGVVPPHDTTGHVFLEYGNSDGQLGAMRDRAGGVDGVVSSPPYEGMLLQAGGDNVAAGRRRLKQSGNWSNDLTDNQNKGYGQTEGQLGGDSGDNFWQAAKEILTQTYNILRPGGHACWVVKAFVRNKRVVDFPDQWRRLCESVGFRTLHLHRAWLVEVNGYQERLDGGEADRVGVERKSFFRRLSERRGSPRIDFEIVLCMEKPV